MQDAQDEEGEYLKNILHILHILLILFFLAHKNVAQIPAADLEKRLHLKPRRH